MFIFFVVRNKNFIYKTEKERKRTRSPQNIYNCAENNQMQMF